MSRETLCVCAFCGEPRRADATCVADCWLSRFGCPACGGGRGPDDRCLSGCDGKPKPADTTPTRATRNAVADAFVPGMAELRVALSCALTLLCETHRALVEEFELTEGDGPRRFALVEMEAAVLEHECAIDLCGRALMEGRLA